jgi:hypothetical protein
LVLQARAPDAPFDMGRVEARLGDQLGPARPDGARDWHLTHGDVEILPLRDGGRVLGAELRVPLVSGTELMEEVLKEAAALAWVVGARVYDPQLERVLAARDTARVVEQYVFSEEYSRTAKPMEITPGLDEAMERLDRVDRGLPPDAMSMTTKMLLFALGGGALLFFVMRSVVAKLTGEE